MPKTSVIARNRKRDKLEQRYRTKREELKALAQQYYVKQEIPWDVQRKLQSLPRNTHRTRVCKRCRICGRAHAVYKKFGLCRLCLRILAMSGYVPGLVKSSW